MSWEPLSTPADHTHDIADTIQILHRRLGLACSDVLSTLEENWVQLLGSELATHCVLESVRNEVLVVVVDDPAIADHLKWSRTELLGAANALSGGENFTDLKIKVQR
ncbi:unannotated protein [freshwater metagenome]|uniref:Unannotated protein n=1 Tax=freshwater metagenome TaxID=449393 RepID=A0A6J7G4P9_9ZZZZ|nr:DUF721 domain-containing protein [Actinomycetota bacterium]MSY78157.1 DUF721 domain-containing protein [Actinomycetota bacterium]